MINHKICTFYIVRHGESEANYLDIYGLDLGLTEKGKQQIKDLSKKLKNISFDAVFSSDIIRAKQSAEIIATGNKLPVITHRALRERFYGTLEEKKALKLKKNLKTYLKKGEIWNMKIEKDLSFHKIMNLMKKWLSATLLIF